MINRRQSAPSVQLEQVYTQNRKFRVALYGAIGAFGLLLLSLPLWAIDSPGVGILVASVGGVLMAFGFGAIVQEWIDPTYDSVIEAFALSVEPNSAGNLRDVIRGEVTRAVAEVASSSVDFGPRAKLQRRLNLMTAEDEVVIQSISLSQKWQTTQMLEELLQREPGLSVRICLMHPYSEHVALREIDLGFQPGTLRQLIDETIQPLSILRNSMQLADRLSVRGYFATPYYGITCCDRKRMVISLSREGRGGDQNLGIYLESSSDSGTTMVADLLAGFERRWSDSLDLLRDVGVAFVPGSEKASGGRISYELETSEEMQIGKFRVQSDSARIMDISAVSLQGDGRNVYRVVAQYDQAKQVQIFEVREALSQSNAWLRSPVRITLPPPSSMEAS